MIRRWWQWLTNPTPMAGQVWSVDGIGLVEITSVKHETSLPLTLLTLGLAMDVRLARIVSAQRLSGGQAYRWYVHTFRSQARIRPLTLQDLSDGPPSPRDDLSQASG